MTKYNSKKTTYDGITFDSKSESNYYKLLKKREKDGEITALKLQPTFTLQNAFKLGSQSIKAITYKADFSYLNLKDNTHYVVDVKGMSTEVANIKRKMFNYIYKENYKLLWVVENKKWGKDGWIEYDELKKIRAKNKKK